jgi:hypothetical protein
MSNTNKKNLGQFYTTNYEYILQDMIIDNNITNIIEPFCGNGDLLKFIKNKEIYNIECYDIDPKHDYIIYKDTLLNPPSYTNKFILTNPPYLARNKCINKNIFDKYNENDLYKCFIKELLINECLGGIIIIPLNFWCSIRKNDIKLRKQFMIKYSIIKINIFEEKVFNDTTYTICSCHFMNNNNSNNDISITIYPSKININTQLNDKNNYLIGGQIYNLKTNNIYNINRITSKNKNSEFITNIRVKCIDDNENNKIGLSINNNIFIDETPNLSARTYASLIIEPKINKELEEKLVIEFNKYFNNYRDKYKSLFLCNYRESKVNIARKRISFELVYKIVEYLLEQINKN